jgi:surface antigen
MRLMFGAGLSPAMVMVGLAACTTDADRAPKNVEHPTASAIESERAPESLFAPEILAGLSDEDREHIMRGLDVAIHGERGKMFNWKNPMTGNSGSAILLRRGFNPDVGRTCAELRQTLIDGGHTFTATGYSCRGPSGAWTIEPELRGNHPLL